MRSPAWSGQFVVTDWPFTDRFSSKRRPALVLEEPDAHGDPRVLKVTSRSPAELAVVVTPEDHAEGQHKTTSYLRLWHSLMIHNPLDIDQVAQPITLDFWPTFGNHDTEFQQEQALSLAINQQ